MGAFDEVIDKLTEAGLKTSQAQEMVWAAETVHRAEVLAEVLAAMGDPARRQQAAAHFNMGSGLGWETARDIVRLVLDPTIPMVGCPACRHRICDGNGPCGAILSVSAVSDAARCQCTTGWGEGQ